jgi:hypothetical protein
MWCFSLASHVYDTLTGNKYSMYEDMVALNLFRSLDQSQRLPDELGTCSLICLHHCERTLETSERCFEVWSADDYSIMSLYPLYHVAITLLHMLHDIKSHDLFERVCTLLARFAGDFSLARYILQAMKSAAVRLLYPLPRGVASMFRGMKLSGAESVDVATTFVLPANAEIWNIIYEEGQGAEEAEVQQVGIELGVLISMGRNLELSSEDAAV